MIPTASVVALLVLGAAMLPAAHRGGATGDILAKAPKSLDDLKNRPIPTANGASSSGPVSTARVLPPEKGPRDTPRLLPADGGAGGAVLDRPGRTPGAPRVMVLGDSVPFLLGEELVAEQASLGLVVANRAVPACSAADPDAERVEGTALATPTDCAGLWISDAQAFDPDVVIVSLNGDVGLELQYDGTWGTACSPAYADRLTSRVSERLATVTARGARAYLLTPLEREQTSYHTKAVASARKCLTALEKRIAAANPQLHVVEFGEWICPDPTKKCRTSLAGTPVPRADGVHFVRQQAKVVWSLLLPKVLADAGVS